MNKTLDYYLSLPWSFSVEKRTDEGEYYLARVNELKCFSDGQTAVEAFSNIMEALKLHLETALEEGDPIQEPPKPEEYKGQIAYRTKPEKHYHLAKEAQRRQISINKLIDQAVDDILSA
jgi:predicted RNase H-like HicB family nuclease